MEVSNWLRIGFQFQLAKFSPFVADGVIFADGRLQRSNLLVLFKHPVVLPKRHYITGLMINDAHGAGGHLAFQYVADKLQQCCHILGQGRTISSTSKLSA